MSWMLWVALVASCLSLLLSGFALLLKAATRWYDAHMIARWDDQPKPWYVRLAERLP